MLYAIVQPLCYKGEDQDLDGWWSESDGTHFVEEIDPNFPAGKYTNELDSISLIGLLISRGYWIVFTEYHCQNLAVLRLRISTSSDLGVAAAGEALPTRA